MALASASVAGCAGVLAEALEPADAVGVAAAPSTVFFRRPICLSIYLSEVNHEMAWLVSGRSIDGVRGGRSEVRARERDSNEQRR